MTTKHILGAAALVSTVFFGCLALTQKSQTQAETNDSFRGYVEMLRAELRSGKVKIINGTMHLTEEEAAKFWPIYHDYEIELFAWGDRRLDLTKRFVRAHRENLLDNENSETMAVEWFKLQAERLKLLEKYHGILKSELSALRALQFGQIEYRVGALVDLMIASEVPLVRVSGK